jgi:LPS-assembly protein
LKSSHLICRTALPLLFLYLADPAAAQEPVAAAPAAAPIAADGEQRRVNFTSDQLVYDTESEVVTVSGNVEMTSEGNNLRADRVIWNRNTGEVRAEGNVRVVNPQGDAAYGDSIVLTDTLRDGVIDNLLLVLEDGGRLAADRAERREGFTTLYRAAYSPCAVVDAQGCPRTRPGRSRRCRSCTTRSATGSGYRGASLSLFGAPIIAFARPVPPGRLGGRRLRPARAGRPLQPVERP